ncbi:hypothetical protein [uncultured Meiothermus sp.]|jgi:hypothetical protein|uniref:hypothetical protein n=1 Tax=uncultured Meiothermus sp. TaxID=157471 RepID=UPI00262DAABA|nr:hypothetical protein [uncultured Meiothermus sp.]
MPPAIAPRDTPERDGQLFSVPVGANRHIWQGTLVVSDAGWAAPGRTALNLRVIGRAEENANNTGGANGAIRVLVRRGVFKFDNDPADLVTQAELWADCFITDDQTVSRTNGTNTKSRAGRVVGLDADGVWVDTR